jgi:hypothetical protein
MLQPEAGKLRQDMDGGIRPDGKLALFQRAAARQEFHRFRLGLELALGDGEELPSHLGEVYALCRAVEKLDAVCLFKLPHVVGYRGLGETQRLASSGEAPVDGDGMKGFQLRMSHIVQTYMFYQNIRFD